MKCGRCGKDFGDCPCDDLDERLAALRNNDHFIYKMCSICGLHFRRCKCDKPVWISSYEAKYPLEELLNKPTLADILENERLKSQNKLN